MNFNHLEENSGLHQRRLDSIFEASPDAIIIIDRRGGISSVNPAVTEMFGYTEDELIGKNVNILMPKSYSEHHDRYLENYVRTRQAKVLGSGRDVEGMHKDGSVFPVHLSLGKSEIDGEIIFTGMLRDLSDIREVQRQLKESEQRLIRSQCFANIGTWDWNIQTGDLYWSERIAPMFGGPETEMATTYDNFLAAIHPGDRQSVIDAVNACVEDGADYDIEHRVVWDDGTIRWLQERGDVVRDQDGEPTNMLGVVQDITRAKFVEENLKHAKEEAEIANRAKSEFLSSMSHELRTPLNAIIGFAEAMSLGMGADDESWRQETLCQIADAGRHLNELLGDVLDFSKIEEGKLDLVLEDTVPADVFDECIPLVNHLAEADNITLKLNKQSENQVHVDRARLRQVFLNLISNAIKYNHPGGRIEYGCYDVSNSHLRVYVKDTGIGIPESKKDAVFEPFERLRDSAQTVAGTGIGLSISRKLVESMGGVIGVESDHGCGSTFWCEFPIAGAGGSTARAPALPRDKATST